MHVKLKLTEAMLGTWPNNPSIAEEFIASRAVLNPKLAEDPDKLEKQIESEVEALTVEEQVAKSMTVFPRHEGKPCMYDYQIKGFFKDTCGALSRLKESKWKSPKLKAYKKIIDGLIFVEPRYIPIVFEGEMGNCQRPLRAQTPQGERISLANSEEIPAGAEMEFDVICFDPQHEELVIEWLKMGKFRGLGQWRNSGKGRFLFEATDDKGKKIAGNS